MADDLAEGSLFVELQVPSWPPLVSQTLLRNSDGRRGLVVRAKPSGRLRVELARQGHEPIVVRSMHLTLRAPALLRLNIVWRGMEAAVIANGQVIGTSDDFNPQGFVAPSALQQTEAPRDHPENDRARAVRHQHVETMLSRLDTAEGHIHAWYRSLANGSQIVADLAELVREGRRHHLPGLVCALHDLIIGERHGESLLQWCAGLLDIPLLIYAPMAAPRRDSDPAAAMVAAFDVAPNRADRHEFAVDLDVWLQHAIPWLSGQPVAVSAILSQIRESLAPALPDRRPAAHLEPVRLAFSERSDASIASLCVFADTICNLARTIVASAAPPPRTRSPGQSQDSTAGHTKRSNW